MKHHNAEVHCSVHEDGLVLDIRERESQTVLAHIILNENGVISLRASLTRYLKTGTPQKPERGK